MRWMLPREHGAYVQLAVPLAAALGSAGPSLAAGLLAVAAVLGFFAHEPALVWLGQRGGRALREHGEAAGRAAALLLGGAGALGVAGLALSAPLVAWATALPLVLGIGLSVLIRRRRERTTAGEVLAAATLAATALPVALAAGASVASALAAWLAFVAGFSAATLGVRRAIHQAKGKDGPGVAASVGWPLLLAVTAALTMRRLEVAAAVPLLAFAAAIAARPPRPSRLREIGWALTAAAVAAAVIVVVGARI